MKDSKQVPVVTATPPKPSTIRQQQKSAEVPPAAAAAPPKAQPAAKPQPKKVDVTIMVTEEDIKLRRTPIYDASRLKQKPLPKDIPDLAVIEVQCNMVLTYVASPFR